MNAHRLTYTMRRYPVLKSYGTTAIIDAMVMFGRISDAQASALRIFHMGCCGLYCPKEEFEQVIKRSVREVHTVDEYKGIDIKHHYDIHDDLIALHRPNALKRYVIYYPGEWTHTNTSSTPPPVLSSPVEILEDVLWMSYVIVGNRPTKTSRIIIKDINGLYQQYHYA